MRKVLIAALFTFAFLLGSSVTLFADKKDDKGKKGHPPVIIIVWESAWPPVTRAAALPDIVDMVELPVEDNAGEI